MFDMFTSVVKAAVGVVTLPVSVVADAVTMGGALLDKEQPYTSKNFEDIITNLGDAVDPTKK